jgi:hypothetical protein
MRVRYFLQPWKEVQYSRLFSAMWSCFWNVSWTKISYYLPDWTWRLHRPHSTVVHNQEKSKESKTHFNCKFEIWPPPPPLICPHFCIFGLRRCFHSSFRNIGMPGYDIWLCYVNMIMWGCGFQRCCSVGSAGFAEVLGLLNKRGLIIAPACFSALVF